MRDLNKLIDHINIAELLSESELYQIGANAVNEYNSDLSSRAEWELMIDASMNLAKQVKDEKSFPWPGASNIKYPSISMAAIQFAARAYPEIVKDGKIAGAKVIGKDTDGRKQARADRISKFLDYQLTEQIENWEEETDKLLHILPIAGLCWRKIYFDSTEGPRSELIMPKDVVVHYFTKCLKKCPRITHRFPLYHNEIITRQRSGEYLDVDIGMANPTEGYDDTVTDAQHIFLEQHRWLDLDDDGYKEPYVVTVEHDSNKVVRIVARYNQDGINRRNGKIVSINPIIHFEKYGFIPAPDGSFYDIGFGSLLGPLNASINTAMNQLFDAGTLANTGGGFIGKGARLKGGSLRFRPGEWKPIDTAGAVLRDSIVQLPMPVPSQVLFNMLTLLIQTTKELSTVSSEMTGGQTSPNEPATSMLARLEQGMKVFSAIHKRIYRSLSGEINKIYELDRQYLTPEYYANIVDDPDADLESDFEDKSIDIKPVCDPSMSSEVQKMVKLQAAGQILSTTPGADMHEYAKMVMEAISIPGIDKLLPDQEATPPPPDPKMLEMQAQMQLDKANLQKEAQQMKNDYQIEMQKMKASMMETHAEINLKAKAQQDQLKIELKKLEVDIFNAETNRLKLAQETPQQTMSETPQTSTQDEAMTQIALRKADAEARIAEIRAQKEQMDVQVVQDSEDRQKADFVSQETKSLADGIEQSMKELQQIILEIAKLSSKAAAPRRTELVMDEQGMPVSSISYPVENNG